MFAGVLFIIIARNRVPVVCSFVQFRNLRVLDHTNSAYRNVPNRMQG